MGTHHNNIIGRDILGYFHTYYVLTGYVGCVELNVQGTSMHEPCGT